MAAWTLVTSGRGVKRYCQRVLESVNQAEAEAPAAGISLDGINESCLGFYLRADDHDDGAEDGESREADDEEEDDDDDGW